MGLCSKNKGRSPARRNKAVDIEPTAASRVEPVKEAAETEAAAAEIEEARVSSGSLNERNTQEAEPALPETPAAAVAAAVAAIEEAAAAESNEDSAIETKQTPDIVGVVLIHGNAPPTRHDSTATSCAGMTDAEALSRRVTLQQQHQQFEEQQQKQEQEQPQEQQDEQQQQQPEQREDVRDQRETRDKQLDDAAAAASTEQQKVEQQQREEEQQDGASAPAAADSAGEPSAPPSPRTFTSKVQETFASVKKSISRGYQSLSSLNMGGNRTAATESRDGDLYGSEPPASEQCVCNVLNDITELSEKAMPCILGDNSESETEAASPLPPAQIKMIVNTPSGPYIRFIPDELLGDAINMGFISEEEVERQREEWAARYGIRPISYTPAASFAHEQAKA
ncbi:hypothetical protein, conserved [Eimeria tenella]|uniref:Uncharacterized protein n=1 Tax=Eimeria tenella TaxID=5802 RepID=U6KXX0_EIMTE|nr:hypothetical protein, conserved [Eimeria tenella]CDJ41179.1 hypothetical protein, conserved [Eimeria tenella]|eukprot:XP_013231929.1 hypothetical protein, conserved [Eimeria tenella]